MTWGLTYFDEFIYNFAYFTKYNVGCTIQQQLTNLADSGSTKQKLFNFKQSVVRIKRDENESKIKSFQYFTNVYSPKA